jgi:hypothetical protein
MDGVDENLLEELPNSDYATQGSTPRAPASCSPVRGPERRVTQSIG